MKRRNQFLTTVSLLLSVAAFAVARIHALERATPAELACVRGMQSANGKWCSPGTANCVLSADEQALTNGRVICQQATFEFNCTVATNRQPCYEAGTTTTGDQCMCSDPDKKDQEYCDTENAVGCYQIKIGSQCGAPSGTCFCKQTPVNWTTLGQRNVCMDGSSYH
jgi:hypothetical protein